MTICVPLTVHANHQLFLNGVVFQLIPWPNTIDTISLRLPTTVSFKKKNQHILLHLILINLKLQFLNPNKLLYSSTMMDPCQIHSIPTLIATKLIFGNCGQINPTPLQMLKVFKTFSKKVERSSLVLLSLNLTVDLSAKLLSSI